MYVTTPVSPRLARRFEGQIALITGGGTGIGAAIATQLAAEGAKVALVGRRATPLNTTAEHLRSQGYTAHAFAGNVATDAQQIVDAVVQHFGGLDILVNNAAIAAGLGPATGARTTI